MTSRSLGHRAPLLWLVLPFIGGLAWGKIGATPQVAWLLTTALVAAALAFLALWRLPRLWAPAVIVAMTCTGAASYALQRARLPAWDALPPREVRLTLRVDRVFNQSLARRTTGLATVVRADEHLRDLAGQRVYFSLNLRKDEAPPIRSATISAMGIILTLPRDPPSDSFDAYLAGAGVNFLLTRGRVLGQEAPALAYYRFCAAAAERCHDILGAGIARKRPALAGLLRAMMLGTTHDLSDEQQTLFMQSGTMHLFAISGLNIGVIAAALQVILLLFRLPAWARLLVGSALLWLFVDITGTSPSAVRAFVMVVFLQAAFVLRQPGSALAALVASAFCVLLVTPLQVFSGSFLMSYGIVAALLLLGVPLGEVWLERWTPWRDLPKPVWTWWQHAVDYAWRIVVPAVSIGIATMLVGLVTGVQFFQLLTPGALLSNLVLIPLASFVTLAGFASLLCGFAGFTFGASIFNHAAAMLLVVIEWLVRVSVKIPGAFLTAHFTHAWIGPLALAALLATMLAGYSVAWRSRWGGWWTPFAVIALVLIFGVAFGNA